jgi:hypothetical protein
VNRLIYTGVLIFLWGYPNNSRETVGFRLVKDLNPLYISKRV